MSALIDADNVLTSDVGSTLLKFSQEIPQTFLDTLKSDRLASTEMRANEFHRVASVPTVCYDLWIRQGKDPYRWSARELLMNLNRDGLDAFITTNKVV